MAYDNPIIKKRFEEKMKRLDKTSLSILVSWAINNSTNFLPEKLKGTAKGFKQIQKWYPKFIDEYRNWMLENMPTEPSKITYEDIKTAKVEAPASQAAQEKVDEIQGEERMKEANRAIDETTTEIPPEEIPIINE